MQSGMSAQCALAGWQKLNWLTASQFKRGKLLTAIALTAHPIAFFHLDTLRDSL
jgi:hypothetical protein